jgi:general secretion pathway protein H
MTAARPFDQAVAGFTLVEMLVVVTILALIAGIALPFFARTYSDSLRLQSTTDTFLAALRLTRAKAILGNTEAVFVIDVDRHTFESPAIPTRAFESDVLAALKVAEPERPTQSRGGFRFFPDGSSTGGDLSLRLHGLEAKICVYWLTGEARQGATC